MKKSKLLTLFVCGCLCLCMGNSMTYNDEVSTVYVDDLSQITEEVVSTNGFDTIYVQNGLDFSSEQQTVETSNIKPLSLNPDAHEEEILNASTEGILMAKYFFQMENGKIGTGYLLGTENTSEEQFRTLLLDTQANIRNNAIQNEAIASYNSVATSSSLDAIEIGDDWQLVLSKKISWSMDYGNKHYGDFAEWHHTFEIRSSTSRYLLVAHESYIAPNSDGSRYRAKSLTYEMSPDPENDSSVMDASHLDSIVLRDYAPKAKSPSETISYGFDIGAEITSEGVLAANIGFSVSYSATKESPTITDQGNMAKDIAKIVFDYIDYDKASGDFVNYCKNQTMQSASYLFKGDNVAHSIVLLQDKRTITMYYRGDWPWTKISCDFHIAPTVVF